MLFQDDPTHSTVSGNDAALQEFVSVTENFKGRMYFIWNANIIPISSSSSTTNSAFFAFLICIKSHLAIRLTLSNVCSFTSSSSFLIFAFSSIAHLFHSNFLHAHRSACRISSIASVILSDTWYLDRIHSRRCSWTAFMRFRLFTPLMVQLSFIFLYTTSKPMYGFLFHNYLICCNHISLIFFPLFSFVPIPFFPC